MTHAGRCCFSLLFFSTPGECKSDDPLVHESKNYKLKHHLVLPVADGSLDNIALTVSNVILSQFSALEDRNRAPKVMDAFTIFFAAHHLQALRRSNP